MSAKKERPFEENMKRLQEIVDALESPDVSLEKGMALYKEGLACSRLCREKLEKARHDLEIWRDGEAEVFRPSENAAFSDRECGEN